MGDDKREGRTMANPETCLHNVIGAQVTEGLELVVTCISCGTDVSSLEKRARKNYRYDHNYHVWVHQARRAVAAMKEREAGMRDGG